MLQLLSGKNLYAFGEGGSVTCEKEEYYKHIDRLKIRAVMCVTIMMRSDIITDWRDCREQC